MTGDEVQYLRIQLSLKQRQMAALCGSTLRGYQKWEAEGVKSNVTRRLLEILRDSPEAVETALRIMEMSQDD